MKEPHNYRKVGYSMIVISVSLVVIGLIVWAIGNNYHFSSELMAGQEIDSMTPKTGYNIVSFDYTAPIGAKLKLLDHTDSINDTKKLQDQYKQSISGVQILVFGSSRETNLDLMAHEEVFALTPTQGYNVILFNHAMPVGAKLSLAKNDNSLVNATKYEQQEKDQIKDPDVSVIIFSSSYADNLVTVLGSGSPTANITPEQNTTTSIVTLPITNATMMNSNGNESISEKLNTTNNTSSQIGQETLTLSEQINVTSTHVNQTTNGTEKSINLNESVGITTK